MRANRDEIGTPVSCSAENRPSHVSDEKLTLCSKTGVPQFARNPLDQCASRRRLTFQLGCVILGHLRWGNGLNRLQHMQDQDLGTLMPNSSFDCT